MTARNAHRASQAFPPCNNRVLADADVVRVSSKTGADWEYGIVLSCLPKCLAGGSGAERSRAEETAKTPHWALCDQKRLHESR